MILEVHAFCRVISFALLGVLILSSVSQTMGTEWSDAQKQVWQLEQAYCASIQSGDIDTYMDLVHDSVVAWPDSKKEPIDKTRLSVMVKQMMNANIIKSYEITPEDILVIEDTAIVFYSHNFKTSKGNRSSRVTHTWKKRTIRGK